MKKWEIPMIETLEIASTSWEILDGQKPDGMEYLCDPLYYES